MAIAILSSSKAKLQIEAHSIPANLLAEFNPLYASANDKGRGWMLQNIEAAIHREEKCRAERAMPALTLIPGGAQ